MSQAPDRMAECGRRRDIHYLRSGRLGGGDGLIDLDAVNGSITIPGR